jgi:predicted nucleotidyltransferase/predicted transcriptional regulator
MISKAEIPKATVYRLDPDAQAALAHLGKLMGRPMNKLVNEAVRDYLLRTTQKERDIEGTLASLRAYREAVLQAKEESAAHPLTKDPEADRGVREFVRRASTRFDVKATILFGSRARGTHRADSDVDLAVLLQGSRGRLTETSLAMADIAFDVLLETNIYITPLPIWADEWEHPETYSNPRLLENIKRDGRSV